MSETQPEITREPFNDSTPISEIEPIEHGGLTPQDREGLRSLVEAPLLDACQLLYDKGVKTVFSSANRKDVGGSAHIAIDFDTLSANNKAIAARLGTEGMIHGFKPRKGIYINFPITPQTTLGEIREASIAIAEQFEQQ